MHSSTALLRPENGAHKPHYSLPLLHKRCAGSSASGVNVDEETQRLSELEELYSLAAQILSMTGEMFDTLLAAVQ